MSSIQRIPGRRRWRVRWREGGRGSPLKPSPWFDSLGEAEEFQRKLDTRLAAAREVGNRLTIPLDELVLRWETWQRGRKQPRSERYIAETKRTLLRLIETHKWTTTEDVGELDVPIGDFRLVKALLGFARDRHDQTVNPKSLLPPDRPRRKRRKPALPSLEDVLHMVACAQDWRDTNGAIAHLVAVYGHRPQSLIHLTPDAFEISWVGLTPVDQSATQGFVTLTVKSGAEVRHPILPATVNLLWPIIERRRKLDPTGVLFLNHRGKSWRTGQEFSAWFHHYAGNGRGVYLLKRYAITFMYTGGLDVPTISSITGHSTDTILRYLASNDDLQQKALTMMGRSGVIHALEWRVTEVRPVTSTENDVSIKAV